MLEDKILVWKMKEGSEDALRQVYQKYKDAVYTIALSLLNDQSQAEDVLGDVFIAFVRSVRHLPLHQNLKSYLLALTVNNITDRFRKKMYQVISLERVAKSDIAEQHPESLPASDEQSVIICDALANVPLQQREVLCLHLQAGLGFGQIARIVNIPQNTAQARYYYGIEAIRTALNRTVYKMNGSNHYGQVEESISKLLWSTDEPLDKKILDSTIATFDEQTRLWAGWKFLAGTITVIAATAIIFITAALFRQAFLSAQKEKQVIAKVEKTDKKIEAEAAKEPTLKKPPVKETLLPVKTGIPAAKSEAEKIEEEFNQIVLRISSDDIEGLAKILSKANPDNRLAAAVYLAQMDSKRAIEILDILSAKSGANEPNNIFAVTSAILKKRLEEKTGGIRETAVEEKKIQKQESMPKVVLSGHIIDLETNQPVGNVSVILEGPSKSQVLSDVNGFYHFDKVENEGRYKISIQSKQYLDGLYPGLAAEMDLNNDVDMVKDFTLALPASTIKLKIVNEANEPIRGAFVYEERSVTYEEPNKAVYLWGTAERTNENGEVILGCFESSGQIERIFIATAKDYAPEKLAVVLNNPRETAFYKLVMKKEQPTRTDSNEPPQ